MNSTEKILLIAKTEKIKLWESFVNKQVSKSLTKHKRHELNALIFLSIEKPIELCKFFRTSFFLFQKIINNPSYKQYSIAKKKGGSREIFAPENKLKKFQKRLNYFLQAYYLCIKPKEVHGFVINPHYLGTYCNIVENAKIHTNKKYVLNVDLKDFFPNISAKQVKEVFSSPLFNFNEQISTALTLLTTFKGNLPIGAPTSPVISNFICTQLDKDLIQFCEINALAYTRYADDLTFSSNNPISNDIVLDIINLIRKNNFKINEKKLRLRTANQKQTVTGITVNEKVNVDRKLLKKTRAMLHDLLTNGIDTATQRHFNIKGEIEIKFRRIFIHRLEGYINFIGQVRGKNDSIYTNLKTEFDNLFNIPQDANR